MGNPDPIVTDAGPPTSFGQHDFCCQMRAHFIIGLIGENKDVPVPFSAVDFIQDWNVSDDPKTRSKDQVGETMWIKMRYCPFCGKEDPFYTRDIETKPA
jgi:hypothetical protein